MTRASSLKVALFMKKPGNIRVTEQLLSENGICARGISSEAELDALFATDFIPDVALVDVSGFGPSAWQICAALQGRSLPFVVISQPADMEISTRSLQFGAMRILQKPVAKTALLQLIQGLAR